MYSYLPILPKSNTLNTLLCTLLFSLNRSWSSPHTQHIDYPSFFIVSQRVIYSCFQSCAATLNASVNILVNMSSDSCIARSVVWIPKSRMLSQMVTVSVIWVVPANSLSWG